MNYVLHMDFNYPKIVVKFTDEIMTDAHIYVRNDDNEIEAINGEHNKINETNKWNYNMDDIYIQMNETHAFIMPSILWVYMCSLFAAIYNIFHYAIFMAHHYARLFMRN